MPPAVRRGRIQIDDYWIVVTTQGSRAPGELLQNGAADAGIEQPRPRLHCRLRIAGGRRPTVLRLEQVHVTAARHVVRVPCRAEERASAALDRQPAAADRARQTRLRHLSRTRPV